MGSRTSPRPVSYNYRMPELQEPCKDKLKRPQRCRQCKDLFMWPKKVVQPPCLHFLIAHLLQSDFCPQYSPEIAPTIISSIILVKFFLEFIFSDFPISLLTYYSVLILLKTRLPCLSENFFMDPFISLYPLKLRYSLSSFICSHLSSLLPLLILHISLRWVPSMFIVLNITFIVTNPKSITVALNFRFLSLATSEYFYLDISKPPHICHAQNLTQLPTPLPTQTCSLSNVSLSQWMVLLHPPNCSSQSPGSHL